MQNESEAYPSNSNYMEDIDENLPVEYYDDVNLLESHLMNPSTAPITKEEKCSIIDECIMGNFSNATSSLVDSKLRTPAQII